MVDMFADARLGKAVDPQATVPLVRDIADSVLRQPAALISVARLKTHDDYTYLHSVAVCALMLSLAHQLGLDEEQAMLAGMAGLMHDLGKAAIPLEVLNKPGKLSDAEFTLMKQHPEAGARLLRLGGAAPQVHDVALLHHEKVDGSGYPQGLVGENIPLLARMGAICDVYDAVTSERPIRKRGSLPLPLPLPYARWLRGTDTSIKPFSTPSSSASVFTLLARWCSWSPDGLP